MLVLIGDGSRKRVSFIVCKLPPGKEPLLNVETSMALGALPQQFPNWDYTTGKKYEDQDIIHIFGGPDAFEREEDGKEETEPEFDELGFNIIRTVQRIERESTEKGQTLKSMKERLEGSGHPRCCQIHWREVAWTCHHQESSTGCQGTRTSGGR